MPVKETGSAPRLGTGKPLMTRRGRVVVLGAACLVAATLGLVQRQTSALEETPSTDTSLQPQFAAVEPAAAPTPAPKPAARPAARKTAAPASASARPAASASTTLPAPVKAGATTVATAPAPRQQEGAAPVEVVTISGCLEQDDERFRLKDTSGEDAPKGRSWRSGFMRRSSATIDVIDQGDRHHLQTYVGQRVNVTGTLVDKEMQVRSVRILAISCEETSA